MKTTQEVKQRNADIDLMRGLCMVAILLDHTELYMTGDNIIAYNLYVPNALSAFFVISGYLFWRRKQPFSLKKKIISIVKGLLLPYFIFTLLMALPKALFYDRDVAGGFLAVFGGQASWFVAALIVAELIYSTLLYICKERTWLIFLCVCGCYAAGAMMSGDKKMFPWQVNIGLMATLFLWAGHSMERLVSVLREAGKWLFGDNILQKKPNTVGILFGLTAVLLFLKWWGWHREEHLLLCPVDISNHAFFIFDMLVGVAFLYYLCRLLPRLRLLEWTGRHTLVIYFFCGAVPLLVSTAFKRMGLTYEGNYLVILLAFVLVWTLCGLIAWMLSALGIKH